MIESTGPGRFNSVRRKRWKRPDLPFSRNADNVRYVALCVEASQRATSDPCLGNDRLSLGGSHAGHYAHSHASRESGSIAIAARSLGAMSALKSPVVQEPLDTTSRRGSGLPCRERGPRHCDQRD